MLYCILKGISTPSQEEIASLSLPRLPPFTVFFGGGGRERERGGGGEAFARPSDSVLTFDHGVVIPVTPRQPTRLTTTNAVGNHMPEQGVNTCLRTTCNRSN